MSDELQKALAEFVKATLTGFQQGKDFVLAQAPEVIQQLIRWKFWEATTWAVFFGVMALGAAIAARRLWSSGQLGEWDNDGNPMCVFAPLGVVGALALGVTGTMMNGSIALQIYIAPKVWLIEWAMAQVKK